MTDLNYHLISYEVGQKMTAVDACFSVIDSDSSCNTIGASFRKKRSGPEQDMIQAFLQTMPFDVPRGSHATVFQEPRLESGFPDLVVVIWRERITRNWRPERTLIKPQDLRLMHFLHYTQQAGEDDVVAYFGQRANSSLERLRAAEMVRRVGRSWKPYALNRSFAASKIIAIEAKIGKWNEVLNQAFLNTWFASTSYALIPRAPSEAQLAEAQQRGIGVYSFDETKIEEFSSESHQLPRSYASWMLNEWAWRTTHNLEE